jgi:hypothetical protein
LGVDFSNDTITIAAMNEETIATSIINGDNDLRYPETKTTATPRRSVALSIKIGKSTDRQTKTNPTRKNTNLRIRKNVQPSRCDQRAAPLASCSPSLTNRCLASSLIEQKERPINTSQEERRFASRFGLLDAIRLSLADMPSSTGCHSGKTPDLLLMHEEERRKIQFRAFTLIRGSRLTTSLPWNRHRFGQSSEKFISMNV